ncbi:MAG: M48 family metallopeptidase [Reichenbachiella sp.]
MLVVIIVAYSSAVNAQFTVDLKGIVIKKIPTLLEEQAEVTITSLTPATNTMEPLALGYLSNGTHIDIPLKYLDRIHFYSSDIRDFWVVQALNTGVYEWLIQKGYQRDIRMSLDKEVTDLNDSYLKSNKFFADDYLEDYLYTIVHEIHPGTIKDGRPGHLSIKVLKDPSPNAVVYSNGMIHINTGLISLIDSEEELKGILAHEIAHFVLDHHVKNRIEKEEKEKKAAAWAAFATALAATTDIYLTSKNENHIPGLLTAGTAVISYSVLEAVKDNLGTKYSINQELEADRVALNYLSMSGVDSTALSSVFEKMRLHHIKNGEYFALASNGSHPSLDDRILNIGEPNLSKFSNKEFHRKVSMVNSQTANTEYYLNHYEQGENIINKSIESGVATERDYILKAMLLMRMYDTPLMNKNALGFIERAKKLNVSPSFHAFKQEGLLMLRMEDFEGAKIAFGKYKDGLLKVISSLSTEIIVLNNNHSIISYYQEELEWVKIMIYKSGEF